MAVGLEVGERAVAEIAATGITLSRN